MIQWRKKFAFGDLIVVRYADDFVLGFQHQKVAERFLEQLRGRLREYGLELHSEKTRLIQFGRYAAEHRERYGQRKPETFNFLGFTHMCGIVHKTGRFTVRRKTIGKRMAAKLKAIKVKLRRRMHEPIKDTGDWLRAVVQGYFNYHAVPGNFARLQSFRHDVIRHWWLIVRRRGQRPIRRAVFDRLVDQYLPTPPSCTLILWRSFAPNIQTSKIRTVCASERPHGSVRGCVKNARKAQCCTRDEGGPFEARLAGAGFKQP